MKIRKLAGFAAAMLLAACGAGGSGSDSASNVQVQAKAPARSQKSQAADYQVLVQELYVAYFGRPADPGGLTNFSAALQAAGAPTDIQGLMSVYGSNAAVKQLVDSFGTSAESSRLYGSGSTNDFVTAIFQNVLGRAPQSSGLTYWSNAIDSGALTRGDAALAIMGGALANTTDQGKLDAQLIQNRLTVAEQFTFELQAQGTTKSYSGAIAASSARALLSAIGVTTATEPYQTTVFATIASIVGSSGTAALEPFAGVLGGAGATDGLTGAALFSSPGAVIRDSNGTLYVADTANVTIRKISGGVVTTLAGKAGVLGSADGAGASARFQSPAALALDEKGNLYVADNVSHAIRKITLDGVVTTFGGVPDAGGYVVDGPLGTGKFEIPNSIASDHNGNLYVIDGCELRKLSSNGTLSTLGGKFGSCGFATALGTTANPVTPVSLTNDAAGNVYFAASDHTIRKIAQDGTVSLVAGKSGVAGSADGNGSNATFSGLYAICSDLNGSLYVQDTVGSQPNIKIRKISSNGDVTTYPGTLNFAIGAGFAVDGNGMVIVTDVNGDTLDTMAPDGTVSVLAGQQLVSEDIDGTGTAATFANGFHLAADNAGSLYGIEGFKIRKISSSGVVTTLPFQQSDFGLSRSAAVDGAGNIYVSDGYYEQIRKYAPDGSMTVFAGGTRGTNDGQGAAAQFFSPRGLVFDAQGNLFVADNLAIRKITPSGMVTTLASYVGDESVQHVFDEIAIDQSGNLYVSDAQRNAIYKVTQSGQFSLLAGTSLSIVGEEQFTLAGSADGQGAAASFNQPYGLATDAAGNVYVADSGNSTIRKITPAGLVSTLVGVAGKQGFLAGALPGGLSQPFSLVTVGKNLYISGTGGIAVLYGLQ